MKTLSLRPTCLWLATALFLLGGCGGSGGSGNSGGGGGGGGAPPTAAISGPANGVLAIQGDVVQLTITANDDGTATVRVVRDADANAATTGDQTDLMTPISDNDGVPLLVNVATAALAPGVHSIFLLVDDGVNAIANSLYAGPFVVMSGKASVPPGRSATYGVLGNLVVIAVGEAENGNVNLNGDLDTGDGVIGTVDASTGATFQSTVTTDVSGIDPQGTARILEPGVGATFFPTREVDQGVNINLASGDIDQTDVMMSYLNAAGPAVVQNLFGGLVPLGPLMGGTRAICSLAEGQEGLGGTNQTPPPDGDVADTVVCAYNSGTNTFVVWRRAAQNVPPLVKVDGTVGGYLVSEANQTFDLNADADTADTILFLIDLTSPVSPGIEIGRAGFTALHGARHVQPGAAFDVSSAKWSLTYVAEASAGADLNGDADMLDFVPSVYDASLQAEFFPVPVGGTNLNGGNNARIAFYDGSKALYTAIEEAGHSPVGGDNNDGDQLDQEILYWTDDTVNAGAANVLNPVLPGFPTLAGLALDGGFMAEITPGWYAVVVAEAANANHDLSGEGNIGNALLVIDATTTPPTVWNTGLVPAARPAPATIPITGVGSLGGFVVSCPETANGNLNGDADNTDTLLFYVPLASPNVPVNLASTGGEHVKIVGGTIAITANENLNVTDHNQDGDTLDFLFRVVSTAGTVIERGRVCSQTSRPATDTGSLWAFLRSETAEARDLNGNGNQLNFVVGAWRP